MGKNPLHQGQDPPQEGPRKPQMGRALGEVIWADRRVQTEMDGRFLGQAVETLWDPLSLCRHTAGRGGAKM